jgi:hypothetical protein
VHFKFVGFKFVEFKSVGRGWDAEDDDDDDDGDEEAAIVELDAVAAPAVCSVDFVMMLRIAQ